MNMDEAIKALNTELKQTEDHRKAQLKQVITDLKWTNENRMDAVVDTKKLRAVDIGGVLHLYYDGDDIKQPTQVSVQGETHKGFGLSEHAHNQLADKTGIPAAYYDKLRSGHVDLLTRNVNEFIEERDAKMLRTVNGRVMGIMSKNYNCLDNNSAMLIFLEESMKAGAELWEAKLTDTCFYAKSVIPNRLYDVSPQMKGKDFIGQGGKVNDYIAFGVAVSNSEYGCRSLRADIFMLRLDCWNGAISNNVMRTVHLGKANDFGLISQATRELENQALWSGLRDVIGNVFSGSQQIEELVAKMRNAGEQIVTKPQAAMEYVQKTYGLPKAAQESLLSHFLGDRVAGNTMWGVSNAVTAYAKDVAATDTRIDIEAAGMRVLDDKRLIAIATA
jgi:hypothetical protein